MKKYFLPLIVISILVFYSCSNKRVGEPKVLVFSKTSGYVHESIPEGEAAIIKLGKENGFVVDTTVNSEKFNEENLRQYAAVIFLNTSQDVLDYRQEAAFERYIQSGGGFVGIHSATDTEYDWGWYGRLVGAYFKNHPNIQKADYIVEDDNFSATSFLPETIWKRTDELYNFNKLSPDVNVILSVDENSYEGGENGDNHPMSWYHEYDGGRAFYTALGHTKESYSEENFMKHLLGGIEYAIGDHSELDYSKATSLLPPEEDRLTRVQLSMGAFFEPTEMTILPFFDVLILQRRGEILRYKHSTKEVKQVGKLDVYWKSDAPGVNAEEGMLGLAKDPNFINNHWIYIYYSPTDTSVNRLSRFTFENDTVDVSTEKVILDVFSDRDICCHTGGSIAFGPDGLLYVSTGDNSTPFNEPNQTFVNNGYAPLNDAPGHEQYDARRSSGNTNDLRGKILRIKVNEDGSYSIPDGNLFPEDSQKTRPEIYTMGHRNPYRISIDQKNSYLYWGEVGPDARSDSMSTRGPKGYDEVGQARVAGNYGWPLFVADNKAYWEYDYITGKSGMAFDPDKPLNTSRNNTGIENLPPAQPAFIWYPYDVSAEFPQVATGGRNAMAGPVYYPDMYPEATRLPEYYDGKLIIYDWMRGWMKAVTMLPNGDFDKMEPFASSIKLKSLIDMEVAHDGVIYLLEYGNGWFTKNPDSGLSYISYNGGNRMPVAGQLRIDKKSGKLPFSMKASIEAIDPENEPLTYTWSLGNGVTKETTEPTLAYTYTDVGEFMVYVTVKDHQGGKVKSNWVSVYAGNEEPIVDIELIGANKSFYMPGQTIKYKVSASDGQDSPPIDPANFYISVDYVEGYDLASIKMGHQEGEIGNKGKNLIEALDCVSCHKENDKSVGPSYLDVAKRYKEDESAKNYLVDKVITGGGGVWGEVMMPAHSTLSESDAQQIVSWVLSLADDIVEKESLPIAGSILPRQNQKGTMLFSASYTDKGGPNIKSLTGKKTLALMENNLSFTGNEEAEGFEHFAFNSNRVMVYPQEKGWFVVENIDLTNVKSLAIMNWWREAPDAAFTFEVRLDMPDGKVIGKGTMSRPDETSRAGTVNVKIESVEDGLFHKLYFMFSAEGAGEEFQAATVGVQFNSN